MQINRAARPPSKVRLPPGTTGTGRQGERIMQWKFRDNALGTKCSRTCVAIVVACAAIIGTVWMVTYERIAFEREDDIAHAIKETENLALALEQHAVRTIRGVDLTLLLLKQEYEDEGGTIAPDLLQKAAQIDSSYSFLGIVNADGDLVRSTGEFKRINVADRDYFQHHQHSVDTGLRIGGLHKGRVTGSHNMQLSRRVETRGGGFGGVVVAGVDPNYFHLFYSKVDLGEDSLVQLVGLDGIARARRTGTSVAAGADLSGTTLLKLAAQSDKGSFLARGRIDGVQRYVSFRVLREYGLIVSAGKSVQQVLAPSVVRKGWYLLGSSLATLFVLVFGAGLITTVRRQKVAMDAALAGEALYRVTFEKAAVGIAHTALDGRFLRANAKYCQLVGYTEAELLSKTFMDVLHRHDVPSPETMQRVLSEGGIEEEERFVHKDGGIRAGLVAVSVMRDAAGKPDYFVAMVQDITERNAAQARLVHQAHYDSLTGLPNRLLLVDRLAQALNRARRGEYTVGVLYVDLDRFKTVNDTLGHDHGDLLLREASQRMSHSLRAGDSVARAGGDEFVVVLSDVRTAEDAARVAHKIIEAMAAPFHLGGREVFVTASIGVAVFPGNGEDGETLIRNAGAAMSRAKQIGRNNCQFYTAEMNERATERMLLEADLRRALERNEFLLHYQPKVNLATGRITGLEALLRWQRADGKLVSPADFVPVLEESGMIGAVGNWAIEAACAQIRDWEKAGLAPVPVAVNVSTKQFLQGDLRAVVDRALSGSGIEPRLLDIEITESDAMQDFGAVVPVLNALRERGISIAIDDFGTGYSSLAYLSKLPVKALKIDRAFIADMHSEADSMTLVSTMVSLAHSLKLKVIAEGVETEDQSSLLRLLRCDEMQGYLFSRPLPPAECTRYLDAAEAELHAERMAA
jgi:diguanylate cyclase (GGDEF)-like protein/PAS domain S-box-containing protein